MFWNKISCLSVFVMLVVIMMFWVYSQILYSCFSCVEVKLLSLLKTLTKLPRIWIMLVLKTESFLSAESGEGKECLW